MNDRETSTMRLCWVHPTTRIVELKPLWRKLEASITRILRQNTSIEFRFSKYSGNFTRSLYAEHLNSVRMVEEAIKAQDDGFDGVFFGCWNDALWEAREVLNIPVGSVGEQSMLTALTMGRRFAIVTVSDKTAAAIEIDLFAYGLRDRAIVRPVRTVSPASDVELLKLSTLDPSTNFIPRFEEVARRCISDGAEVIVVGCGYYGPLLREFGYNEIPGTGVPVLDCSAVGVKQLEAMVEIGRITGFAKSNAPTFRSPDQGILDRCRKSLRLI